MIKMNRNPPDGWVLNLKPGDFVYDAFGERARGKSDLMFEVRRVAADETLGYYSVYFNNIPEEATWLVPDYDYYVVDCDGCFRGNLDLMPIINTFSKDAGDGE